MNILLSLNTYHNLTGSELYVYELARVLTKRKHTVTILANVIGGEIADKTKVFGVPVYSFFDHPALKPDIMHLSQHGPTAYCLRHFKDIPAVVTTHSPLYYESPILNDRIKRYIAVRPEIERHLIDFHHVPPALTTTIWNGIDMERFNLITPAPTQAKKKILFVGTIDYLRNQAIADLVLRTEKENMELVLVSDGIAALVNKMPDHVILRNAQWHIEDILRTCDETASIFIGRTTIEGWLCSKDGWVYDVDDEGKIKSIDVYAPPKDRRPYNIEYMADRILEVYDQALQV